jgi:UDP-sugar transporter A1/2/3
VVWATIFAQAAGGLIVALVLKYADNVVRSFATAMSIVLSIFIDAWLFGVHLPFNALVGSFMVVLAIIGYTL